MDLRRKLARLGGARPPPSPRAPAADHAGAAAAEPCAAEPSAIFAPELCAAEPSAAAPSAISALGGASRNGAETAALPNAVRDAQPEVLADLRRRMAEVLGRTSAATPQAEPRLSELPFATRDAAGGLLFERIARLPPSLCVGRIPIDAALGCRSEILALLALDPVLSGCDVSRALFLDTESTGLAGAGTVAFLVGTCRFVDGAAVLEQLLLRAPGEERALLVRVAELVADADLIVTYNGKSFDWPLLQSRCVMNRLPALPPRPHLDLLHVARRLHRARLGACRLVTLESEVLGFMRGEDIDGAEVPGRYSHYLRSGDGEALRAVIEHNEWDVLAMAALVGLYGEPLDGLHESDLLGLARTYRRAGDLERATLAAEQAVRRGAGPDALRTRGAIAKARGDRDAALRDFESLEAAVDDPAVRLELAKLYEHHVKAPARALAVAARGTGESSEAEARRVARLERKLRRS